VAGNTTGSNWFILGAFDRDQWCPVLQTLFRIDDVEAIRAILGEHANDDPGLRQNYLLNKAEVAAIIARFGVAFDHGRLDAGGIDVFLFRRGRLTETPDLVHTGYELPLLLDGRKKLARMGHSVPPTTFPGEERFDHWVAKGLLHREEIVDPFDPPIKKYLGHRVVYYTQKGEEWRIPASRLVWEASGKSGGWNEYFERLEGMLFGYEDWQNDWWINIGLEGGGFGGIPLCCSVTAAGLAWMEVAGFRALPPIDEPSLTITLYDAAAEAEMRAFMLENVESAALVCFKCGRALLDILNHRHGGGPWRVPSDRIPELNRALLRSIAIVARRDGAL
jgi:hypothetical protein